MKARVCFLAITLAASVRAVGDSTESNKDGPYDVSGHLDSFLHDINGKLSRQGLYSCGLRDLFIYDEKAYGIEVGHLNTLVRRGMAIIWNQGITFNARMSLGFKKFVISVRSFVYKNKVAPVDILVSDNSFNIEYSIALGRSSACVFRWRKIELMNFDGIATSSLHPIFLEKSFHAFLRRQFKKKLNERLASSTFMKLLNLYINPCRIEDKTSDPLKEIIALGKGADGFKFLKLDPNLSTIV